MPDGSPHHRLGGLPHMATPTPTTSGERGGPCIPRLPQGNPGANCVRARTSVLGGFQQSRVEFYPLRGMFKEDLEAGFTQRGNLSCSKETN